MKRRDFLIGATSSTGLMYLKPVSAVAPCPPILSGAAETSPCSAIDAEQDWQSRISGPGVVWYHDFRSDAEVDNFRWSGGVGNDPQDLGRPGTVRRNTTDGITGACLEIYRPAGSADGAVWWRPFNPMDTGSGKTVNDPGANGTVPVQSWSPVQGGSTTAGWSGGTYGHSDYHSAGDFDGTEYFLQCRLKVDSRRLIADGETGGGKIFYFTTTQRSLTSQEIVTEGGELRDGVQYFSMYRSGSPPLEFDMLPEWDGNNQPGSELGFCDWPDPIPGNCWYHDNGNWDTLMYQIRPGLAGNQDTIVRVWAAHQGETSFTKIWDLPTVNLSYDYRNGHNALICSAYMNGTNKISDFYHRYCQLIFSKEFIPCPQV